LTDPIVQHVRVAAGRWKAFKHWQEGNVHIRGYGMKEAMAAIVLAGTLYRMKRLKVLR